MATDSVLSRVASLRSTLRVLPRGVCAAAHPLNAVCLRRPTRRVGQGLWQPWIGNQTGFIQMYRFLAVPIAAISVRETKL